MDILEAFVVTSFIRLLISLDCWNNYWDVLSLRNDIHLFPCEFGDNSMWIMKNLSLLCGCRFIFHQKKIFFNFSEHNLRQHGRWIWGASAAVNAKRLDCTRYWSQGTTKTVNVTAVDTSNAATTGGLRAEGSQNLWHKEKSKCHIRWTEHDRSERCNVSLSNKIFMNRQNCRHCKIKQ